MDGKSLDIKNDKIEKMKELMPEVFTEGDKIDVEKLNLTLGEDATIEDERYVLNWAGKTEAFKVLQTPTTATLAPDKKESIKFDKTENIFIEGENLEVLKILQKSYFGKIKMIYIDPPYNTGNDSFIYPDKFSESKEDYLKRIGEKDEEGYMLKEGMFRKNSKDSGHYHSNWLSMMYPRLFLARNLLKDNGVIFISIDDIEVHNLGMVMNELFGEENFIGCFLWKKKSTSTNVEGVQVSALCDYILCYGKTSDSKIIQRIKPKETRSYPHKDKDGNYRLTIIEKKDSGSYKRDSMKFKILGKNPREGKRWQIGEQTAKDLETKGRFTIDEEGTVRLKIYDFEDKDTTSAQPNLLSDCGTSDSASKYVNEIIFGVSEFFSNPKPNKLINHLIKISSDEQDDIIMDFFAGSGTTADALIEINKQNSINRKFLIIQMAEKTKEDSEAFKAGFTTIAEICKERIQRVIKKVEEEKNNKPELFKDKELDLGFKVFKLKHSNFKLWRGDVIENGKELAEQVEVFENPVKDGAKKENVLYELMLKSGYELTSKVEKKNGYYSIADGEIAIILSKVNENILKEVIKAKPKKCICLDSLFKNNDQLKTNTVLQMKDAGVEFKTV